MESNQKKDPNKSFKRIRTVILLLGIAFLIYNYAIPFGIEKASDMDFSFLEINPEKISNSPLNNSAEDLDKQISEVTTLALFFVSIIVLLSVLTSRFAFLSVNI